MKNYYVKYLLLIFNPKNDEDVNIFMFLTYTKIVIFYKNKIKLTYDFIIISYINKKIISTLL